MKTPTTIRKALSLLVLALPLLLPLSARAQSTAGKFIFTHGSVTVVDANGNHRQVNRGDQVNEGDHVVTGADGVAQLRLNDGTMIALRGDSDYQIQKQQYNKKDKSLSEQAGELFRGWMRAITGAIAHQDYDHANYKTPVATIGIRGTVFQVIQVPPGGRSDMPDAKPGTYLMLEKGKIILGAGGSKKVVHPGDVLYVADANTPPVLMPEARRFFDGKGEGQSGQQGPQWPTIKLDDGSDNPSGDDINRTLRQNDINKGGGGAQIIGPLG